MWLAPLGRIASLAARAGAVLLALAGPGWAQPQDPPRDGVAAVRQVVMGIISYTRWPVEPPQLRLCVIGPAEYADGLLAGATQPSGRPVKAIRLAPGASPGNDCDVVYLGRIDEAERRQLFSRLAGHPVLSISEQDDSCTVGSMFCLRVQGTQVSFQINLDSVARSGVRVSPKVLQLGRRKETSP
ncbi:YfiR family protein [Inquilinus limosus]|uniref:YfiR family protein n=1 Tax=Inquilinus limosus TaxID=171674 RepID=UPI003F5CCD05